LPTPFEISPFKKLHSCNEIAASPDFSKGKNVTLLLQLSEKRSIDSRQHSAISYQQKN
jgi:hypothetical protein